jgi:hypothetical protein
VPQVNKPNVPGSGPAAPIPTSIASMMVAGQQAAGSVASSLALAGFGAMGQMSLPVNAGGGLSAEMMSAADEAALAAVRSRAAAGVPSFRVYVGSVPFEISAENLKQIFGPFGSIRSVNMLPSQEPGNTGHRGYGFIGEEDEEAGSPCARSQVMHPRLSCDLRRPAEFDDEASGRAAIDAMNGFDLGGRKLKVSSVHSSSSWWHATTLPLCRKRILGRSLLRAAAG